MTSRSFQFDTRHPTTKLNYLRGIRSARESGKSFVGMLWEILQLQFGPGRLQPEEYFMYGLYDDERFTPEIKRTYVGGRRLAVVTPWADIAKDKPTLNAFLRGLDLPVPQTQAIVHPTRTSAGALPLRDREQISRFLREQAQYPIFGKPFDSVCSLGTVEIRGYDDQNDAIILLGDRLVRMNDFIDLIEELGRAYLFQTLMLPHRSLIPLIGNRVSSVRVFVISDEDGCSLLRASWKIPCSQNHADNFWRNGNILAGIDVETGRIMKTLRRTEEGTELVLKHPETDASFESMVFPQWDEMRKTILKAAVNLPGCSFQGWDVALTDEGPVLVELEGDGGSPLMEQLCFESGLLQGRYKRVVDTFSKAEKKRSKDWKQRNRNIIKRNIAALAIPSVDPVVDPVVPPLPASDGVGQPVIAPVSTVNGSSASSVSV